MKTYHIIPSLMAGLLTVALAGCSSSSSSFKPDEAATKAHYEKLRKEQEEKAKQEAEKEAEKARLEQERLAKEKAEKLGWREYQVTTSKGDPFAPKVNQDGSVFYSSGPRVLLKEGAAVKLDDASLNYDREFLKHQDIDPMKVHQLVITDSNGAELGKFQFVNQQYSSYSNFMSAKPANEYGDTDSFEPLAYFIAKPSTADQLNAQKGTFDYRGKAIGYRSDAEGELTTETASTDVHFKVNFDEKVISGRIDKRFDNLGSKKLFWVKGYDDDDNEIYRPEYATRQSLPLILKETKIYVNEGGTASFGGDKGYYEQNVAIELNGELKDLSQYTGSFAGPNLDEVVGQIGGGEERIMFGATKANQDNK